MNRAEHQAPPREPLAACERAGDLVRAAVGPRHAGRRGERHRARPGQRESRGRAQVRDRSRGPRWRLRQSGVAAGLRREYCRRRGCGHGDPNPCLNPNPHPS